jgi:fimbrial isopeptide formation D2 family protein
VSDTPAALATGNSGLVSLAAASATTGAAGAAPGTTLAGLGSGGVDAVVGATQAQASRNGSYLVSDVALSLVKTLPTVLDPRGGSNVETGSVLTYRITVTLTGAGSVSSLVITDPLPAQTTYVAGSILVNGAARTDAADADNARFAGNTVTVDFGNTAAPVVHVIEFRATVN